MTNFFIIFGIVVGFFVGSWISQGAPWWIALAAIPYIVLVYFIARAENKYMEKLRKESEKEYDRFGR